MTTIALITGANKGIGLETARLLGARGMTVLLGCRDEERGRAAEAELRAGGADAHAIALDVTDEESIAAAAKRVDDTYGQLDILINNAGIALGDGAGRPSETTLGHDAGRVRHERVRGRGRHQRDAAPAAPVGRAPDRQRLQRGGVDHLTDQSGQSLVAADVGALPVLEDRPEHGDRDVRQGTARGGFLVNAANPGYCATDLNGHHGFRTATQGAEVSVHLATLPDGGPTGLLWGSRWADGVESDGALPW
jgi:NAD(P)-dependent dehydrogenase (short-subunit alcohol dehydrogenase family)